MDLETLRVFLEVVRRGNFAAVARDRDVTPSAVSRSVSGLERTLGVRLFQRNTRRLSLSEAGRLYFERVEPLVEELERARLMVRDASNEATGTVRITAPVGFAQVTLVPLLPELSRLHPGLNVELLLTDVVLDLLAERIDLAIRLGRPREGAVVVQKLCALRSVVCASPEYLRRHGRPSRPQDLEEHDCLLLPLAGWRSRWRFRDAQGRLAEVPVHGRLLISNSLALSECAAAGMGVTLLPRLVVAPALRSGRLVELFPDHEVTADDFDRAVWLLYPSRSYLPLKVRALVDFLKRKFQQAAASS